MKTNILSFQNTRDHMEDYHFFDANFLEAGYVLVGVYDGHGGSIVSEYTSKILPELFEKHLQYIEPSESFIRAYEQISDNSLEEKGGTCAITCFIKEGIIYHANVGDGKALVIGEEVIELTTEHRITNRAELERIQESEGVIRGPYVFTGYRGLKVTRSLGDSFHKKVGVIAKPSTGEYKIKPSDKYLVIGTDGLFDYVSNEKVAEICKESEDEILESLKEEVLKNKGGDNVTIALSFLI
jgi:serine/threonine protein phosphatase PrpC